MALAPIPSLSTGPYVVGVHRVPAPGRGRHLDGLEAVPDGFDRGPAVLFVHENRGLVPYMRETIEALATHGYLVMAPDLLSRLGGTKGAPAGTSTRRVPEAVHLEDLAVAADALAADERVTAWAVVGLCFGAEMGWSLGCRRRPAAAPLLYRIGPDAGETARIRCPVYAVYARDDPRVNDTVDASLAGLTGAEVIAESYPGTRHAFHDHHRPDRFHPAAAGAVWRRLLAFLDGHLAAASGGAGVGQM